MKSLKILVINSGSSSIKYSLFDIHLTGKNNGARYYLRHKGLIERIGHKTSLVKNHKEGIRKILNDLVTIKGARLKDLKELYAIGHRVVHGGIEFEKPTVITERVMSKIKECFKLAPLHNPANFAGIKACKDLLPDTKQVAIFDTAFYHSLPEYAYIYGLPYKYYEKYSLRKFGFHGTSHQFIAHKAARMLKKPFSKINLITCHLGNGCSITAIKNGRAVDTSMGFTPLEGLVMGTRCGDIDPASVIYLSQKEKITLEQIDSILNNESGLKGISGISNDMREIKRAAKKGHKRASLALDIFIYRIKKYIGSYAAILGSVDAIVFTAGIGEHERDIRSRILDGLFDLLNRKKTRVLVVPTNEELMIAQQTFHILK